MLNLSTSYPVASGIAGLFFAPVKEYPKRMMVQSPAGAVQVKLPSGFMLALRSMTSLVFMTSDEGTWGVVSSSKVNMGPKLALSSQRLILATVLKMASDTSKEVGGEAGCLKPPKSSGPPTVEFPLPVVNTTRKYLAVTSGNEIVRTGRARISCWGPGSGKSVLYVIPSSLDCT